MPKKMICDVPKGCLSRYEIQKDLLEVGKNYEITTMVRGDKKSFKPNKTKMKLTECYAYHYVFEAENKRKHSFMKVDYHLGEWKCKEVR